jgi:purine-nucleoside/S-methyl-5'-thioadenosine phosphorylase / adenosine deaminase
MHDAKLAHVRRIRERHDPRVPALVHPAWASSFPWLVQGTTTRGLPGRDFDLGLFTGGSPAQVVHKHWGRLLAVTSTTAGVCGRQVHGADVLVHASARPGLHLVGPCDGHATRHPDVLLAVTTADCVPVSIVDADGGAVAILHAGWRGTAAGVLERGLAVLAELAASEPEALYVHLGPAICASCYEVGPEVFEALGQPRPRGPAHLDLRATLAERALVQGVDADNITISEHCTRCTGSGLFSHRGGDVGRQVGYLGIRP